MHVELGTVGARVSQWPLPKTCASWNAAVFGGYHPSRKGTVDWFTVAAIDWVELFSSLKQGCSECLQRIHKGMAEYFHRTVVCSVGCVKSVIGEIETRLNTVDDKAL